MLTYEEALHELLATIPKPTANLCPLVKACGLYSANNIFAALDNPPLPQSAMDGFAVAKPQPDTPQFFTCVSESFAGTAQPSALTEGQASKISTGAPVPEGSYAVVPIENCRLDGKRLKIDLHPHLNQWIRPQGMDVKRGDLLVEDGVQISTGIISNLALQGIREVSVYKQPRVAVLTSGNELVSLGQVRLPYQIYNSNELLLTSLLAHSTADLGDCLQLNDTYQDSITALRKLSQEHDVVITVGGASMGERDYLVSALKDAGTLKFWKVKVRPGKPVFVGQIDHCIILGLPGNPVSAFAGFQLFARPLLARLAGAKSTHLRYQWVPWPSGIQPHSTRRDFLRAQWISPKTKDGSPYRLATGQTSGHNSDLLMTDLLLEIPSLEELQGATPDHIRAFFCC